MKRLLRRAWASSSVLVLAILIISSVSFCTQAKTAPPDSSKNNSSGTGTSIDHRILMLVRGDAAANAELPFLETPLKKWGYSVQVFDHTERYDLAGGGDRWYLKDQGGGHGDLDLVQNGNMRYRVIIFDAGDGYAYSDVETPERSVKQMFEEYPFLGIVRMENDCTWGGNVNNAFQVGVSGSAAKSLTAGNRTGIWALEPFKGYQISGTSWGFMNISASASGVTALESYSDGTPAITLAKYASGARAVYFGFKDWGYAVHVSMLVRLIQEYSGMPYVKPYYSLEIDDCGVPETDIEDYVSLINWTKANLGGYPTLAFMEDLLDPKPPAGIMVYGQHPSQYAENERFNPDSEELMAILRPYQDYIVASHGYQHDRDWWRWAESCLPVDPFGDADGDGTKNWLDWDMDGDGVANSADPDLEMFSMGAFLEPDMAAQEAWLKRMREVLDLYGYSDTQVLIASKFEYLDGYTNSLASKYGFTVISAKPETEHHTMTVGWVNGTYVPGRVSPSEIGYNADVALSSAQQMLFSRNFMGYAGGSPVCLVTNHLWQFDRGDSPGYQLRDSYLSAFSVMKTAGFDLVSTQTAANKSIGWLWTRMRSTEDAAGNIALTLDSSPFGDGKARHELDIVTPFPIGEVKAGDDYWICVDGQTLRYGKQSGSLETLQVLRGSYNPALPRITSVSTPATDVLDATYDPSQGRISLMLDGTFSTRVAVSRFSRPFSKGVTTIDAQGNAALAIDLAGVTSMESVNMSVAPSSGSVDVAIGAWSTSGDRYRKWTESASGSNVTAAHVVGDLSPGKSYAVWYARDGGHRTRLETLQADGSGRIGFTYDGGYSTVVFEVQEVGQ
jgi:hypothetical protein